MIPAILNLYISHDKQPCKYHTMISVGMEQFKMHIKNRINTYFYNTFYKKDNKPFTKQ